MTRFSRRAALALAVALLAVPSSALAGEDEHHIVHLMKGQFDTPDNPLSVAPVVVKGGNAIAGWVQGEKGGRALLWKQHGAWQIRLCAGDALRDAKLLLQAGIDPADAEWMTAALAVAFLSVFMSVWRMPAGASGLHLIGASLIYFAFGFRPAIVGLAAGLLLGGARDLTISDMPRVA